jgi:hypothetical protein
VGIRATGALVHSAVLFSTQVSLRRCGHAHSWIGFRIHPSAADFIALILGRVAVDALESSLKE